jgi:hypothetical protein
MIEADIAGLVQGLGQELEPPTLAETPSPAQSKEY